MPGRLGEVGLSALCRPAFGDLFDALRAGRNMMSRHIVAASFRRRRWSAYGALSGHCKKAVIDSRGKIDGSGYVVVVEAQIPLCRV